MVVGTENKPLIFFNKERKSYRATYKKKIVFASQRAGFDDCPKFKVMINEVT